MPIAEVVECEGEDCPDAQGAGGGDTPVTYSTYCPFRDTLSVGSDGTVQIQTEVTDYADGNYNQITLVGGCVAGLDSIQPRGYVPSICCDEDDTTPGTTTDVELAPDACNLTSLVGGQLLTQVQFSPTDDYTVTGCGTALSPFAIQGPTIPESSLFIGACTVNTGVTLSGAGTEASPLKACHKAGVLAAGSYQGITVDAMGHVTAVALTNGASYISTDLNILATGNDNEYEISFKPVTAGNTVTYVGVSISYNDYGQITNITAPANPGLTQTITYMKDATTSGTLTFTDGVLTGST